MGVDKRVGKWSVRSQSLWSLVVVVVMVLLCRQSMVAAAADYNIYRIAIDTDILMM